jgi:MFS family permease
MSTTAITVVDAVVSIGMLLLLPLWGRMTDRFGSRNILYLCTLGIALGALLLAGGGLVLFALSSLLAWRGTQGVLASGKGVAGQALLLTKTVREKAGSYVAAASFAGGVGGLLGSLSGGALLEWLAERPQLGKHFDHYRIYFCLVGVAHVLLAGLVFALDDGQPRLSPTSFLRQAFRGARRRIRRGLCRDRMW